MKVSPTFLHDLVTLQLVYVGGGGGGGQGENNQIKPGRPGRVINFKIDCLNAHALFAPKAKPLK